MNEEELRRQGDRERELFNAGYDEGYAKAFEHARRGQRDFLVMLLEELIEKLEDRYGA